MNDQIQNVNSTPAQQATTAPSAPVSVIVFDKDGNPLPVQAIGPDQVQDIEYSEDPNEN